MDALVAKYESRIRDISPYLTIDSVEVNTEGLDNDVLIINDNLVFRFPRHPGGGTAMGRELSVLGHIRRHTAIPVPAPFHAGSGGMAYPMLHGEPLTKERFLAEPPAGQAALTRQLGWVLQQLHSVPLTPHLPDALAPARYEDWVRLRPQIEQHVFPVLAPHQRTWATLLLDDMLADPRAFDYPPALIHGDLNCCHILYSPTSEQVTAILDFGGAGLGDPAIDLGYLLHYFGGRFLGGVLQSYPEGEEYLRRARFHAQAVELLWALRGLQSGDRSWFVAHIGAARDLNVAPLPE